MEGDDQTFSTKFTNEGLARLREQVEEKLKEFMGDYTDDKLVEYVIVLLKNGRRKDEAKNELDVFLGDDSETFVTWLWDHLTSHISLYLQPLEPHQDGAKKAKSAAREPAVRTESLQIESEAEIKPSRKRRSSEWKELLRDEIENKVHLPENSVDAHVNDQDHHRRRVGRTKLSLSPRQTNEKKRRRPEERRPVKRDVSQTTFGGSRRLLQFAVRDAVKLPTTPAEPSPKRLRSVVATPTEDLFPEKHPKINRLAARSCADMSAAIIAVAEAANDVSKVRPPRNIFDRLGHSTEIHNISINNEEKEYRGLNEDGVGKNYSNEREHIHFPYHVQREINLRQDGVMSHGESYDDADLEDHDFDEISEVPHADLDQPGNTHSTSFKVASSINMDTYRTSQYEDVIEVNVTDHPKLMQSYSVATKSETRLTKENANPIMAVNGNAKPQTDSHQEIYQNTQASTGVYSTGPPTEDADSRTIYVSNVHFAATKDSLSRHFNKFGEVLKVTILTDPATGQPKGSAYIEFTKKEAADHALSLNGTSFLSRILKVLRKTTGQPEASMMSWPRVARAASFPYPVPRLFSRPPPPPFGRGIPSLYRARASTKPGTRSFQWKRGAAAQTSGTEIPGLASNNIVPPPPPITRSSLTYVRTEPKTEAKASGTA